MGLGLREKKILAYALRLSRGPHYDPRIGLPFKDLTRSFFPKAGEAESAVERLRGKGLLEYVTPEAQHARLTLRGRIVAGVVLAGNTIRELRDRLRAAPERRVVTTCTRLALCGLSLVLCFALYVPVVVIMMNVPLPFAFLFLLLLPVGPPLLARHLLQRSHPAVARLSPAHLAVGAILGVLCGLGFQALAPSATQRVSESAVYAACWLGGILLGSFREE